MNRPVSSPATGPYGLLAVPATQRKAGLPHRVLPHGPRDLYLTSRPGPHLLPTVPMPVARSRALRHLLRVGALCLALLPAAANASCLSLPSADLASLDRRTDRDPEAGAREALARIERLGAHADPFVLAQLYAVLSLARFHQSRPDATRVAAAKAEALLDTLPPSADTEHVRIRVRINVADGASSAEAFQTAVRSMSTLVASTTPHSAEHSCALSMRGQARSELGDLALAAGDAFEAYRIAEAGHWPEARVTAAYVLATIYRRSGLLPEAEQMIAEVVALATNDQRTPLLSSASYVRGQILVDLRRFSEAREALDLAHSKAVQIGDQLGAVITDVPLCLALISEGNLAAAARTCNRDDAEFRAAGAEEFLTLLVSYRARLDLQRGRAHAAIRKLNSVLAPSAAGRLSGVRAQALRDRAGAYQMLGDYRLAYEDLRAAGVLEVNASVERQARVVAVIGATTASDKLLASNHMLAERMNRQQDELSHRTATQELWFVIAVAAIMLSILFAYLLTATRRHEHEVARQEMVMRTLSSNAPDAMMLLNIDRTISFANRQLFGSGPTPPSGSSLIAAVPAEVQGVIEDAVKRLIDDRKPVSFPVSVRDEQGLIRHFEMRASPVMDETQLISITLRASDVTEVRRLEREVFDVASRERQRLSSDLHEGLGQELTGISLLLASLATAITRRSGDLEELVAEARGVILRCIDMTRELARGLSPVQIEMGSLSQALSRLALDAARRLRLRITSHSTPPDITVSDVASDHLYRIAYEALTNAARHSGCSNVSIELWVDDGLLNLSISDDGTGMPTSNPEGGGLGVDMMRYRARLLGGTLEVGPGPDGGAEVVVTVPYDLATSDPEMASPRKHRASQQRTG